MDDVAAWILGPLIGAGAGAAATWIVERRLRRADMGERENDWLREKVHSHEVRISILEAMRGYHRDSKRRPR